MNESMAILTMKTKPLRAGIISLVLLLVFLFNCGGYYYWFRMLQYRVRHEIREEIRKGIGDSELTLLTVVSGKDCGLKWTEKGREFSLNGQMYDVVRTRSFGQKTVYYCINDKKEEKLVSDYARGDQRQEHLKNCLKKISHGNYLAQTYEVKAPPPRVLVFYARLSGQYDPVLADIPDPPPDAA